MVRQDHRHGHGTGGCDSDKHNGKQESLGPQYIPCQRGAERRGLHSREQDGRNTDDPQELKANWGESSEEEEKKAKDREGRRDREIPSDEEGKKKKERETESDITSLVGTCLTKDKEKEDKPRSTKEEEEGKEKPKEEDRNKTTEAEGVESEMIKEEDEE